MTEKSPHLRLDSHGFLYVGHGNILFDEIIASYSRGQSMEALLKRFPPLTREELQAALDYNASQSDDFAPRGPERRDAHWRRWNATMAEDWGTDTVPNEPIGGV